MPGPNFSIPLARFGDAPPEGFAATPVTYTFDSTNNNGRGYSGDYVLGQARGFLTQVRTIFVDNGVNASPLTVSWDSGQSIQVAAYSQGYYPILNPGDIRFRVTSSGGTVVAPISITIFLINILLPCSVWSIRGLPISVNYNGNGDQQIPLFAPNAVKTNDLQNSDNAILQGNPGYFVRGVDIYLSLHATIAVAGHMTIGLADSVSGTIWRGRVSVPSIQYVPNQPGIIRLGTPEEFLWTAKAANSTLSVVLSTPLLTGFFSYNLNYGLTNFIG